MSEMVTSVQRAHRTGAPRQNQAKPRPIHVYFGNFIHKEALRKAVIKVFKSKKYKDQKLFVEEDLSKRLMDKRRLVLPSLKKLREGNPFSHTLQF
jgi:hypothetical protein